MRKRSSSDNVLRQSTTLSDIVLWADCQKAKDRITRLALRLAYLLNTRLQKSSGQDLYLSRHVRQREPLFNCTCRSKVYWYPRFLDMRSSLNSSMHCCHSSGILPGPKKGSSYDITLWVFLGHGYIMFTFHQAADSYKRESCNALMSKGTRIHPSSKRRSRYPLFPC